MSRGGYKVNRQSHDYGSGERVSWIDSFAERINEASTTTAVEVARYRNEISVHDQISSILHNKPAHSHSSVESLVNELRDRVGLTTYLKMSEDKEDKQKTASEEVFKDMSDELRNKIITIGKNIISTHRGQLSLPELEHELLEKVEELDAADIGEDELRHLSAMIVEEAKLHPPIKDDIRNIGLGVGIHDDADSSDDDDDVFKGLMPMK